MTQATILDRIKKLEEEVLQLRATLAGNGIYFVSSDSPHSDMSHGAIVYQHKAAQEFDVAFIPGVRSIETGELDLYPGVRYLICSEIVTSIIPRIHQKLDHGDIVVFMDVIDNDGNIRKQTMDYRLDPSENNHRAMGIIQVVRKLRAKIRVNALVRYGKFDTGSVLRINDIVVRKASDGFRDDLVVMIQ